MTLSRRAAAVQLTAAGAALLSGCDAPPAQWPLSGSRGAPTTSGQLETTTIRLSRIPGGICSTFVLAEERMRAAGFTDVQHVTLGPTDVPKAQAAGEIDLNTQAVGLLVDSADEGHDIVILAGIHTGCFELFAGPGIRSLTDLKGKRVAVSALRSGRHLLLAAMLAHVGMNPNRDVTWIDDPVDVAMRRFEAGEIDAFMAFPPEPQLLRARGVGRVVVNTHVDRPWSQYFCCMLTANREWVRKHPVAARQAVRAVLASVDDCAAEPERNARALVDKGYTDDYPAALAAMREVPYGHWRQFNPEDTVRFISLRLKEAGMIKSTPQQLIARATDWRILNELKKDPGFWPAPPKTRPISFEGAEDGHWGFVCPLDTAEPHTEL